MKFYKGRVGHNAYKVSRVWKLGFHIFKTSEEIIFRLCYLRTKEATYYMQMYINLKNKYSEVK